MKELIDYFSPSELLHLVSIANIHNLLKTDQKRFLVALRMGCTYDDGSWQIDQDKKKRFYPILGQFLNELQAHQRCNKDECLICDRFQNLNFDFHGPQLSPEFASFIAWVEGSHGGAAKPLQEASELPKSSKESQETRAERVSVPSQEAASPLGQSDILDVKNAVNEALQDQEAPRPVQDAKPSKDMVDFVSAESSHALKERQALTLLPELSQQPLFILNENHPALKRFKSLFTKDLSLMEDFQVREYTYKLQRAAQDFYALFSLMNQGAEEAEGVQDERRIG